MREILFRGKRKTNNEWVYGNYCGAEYLINEGIEHFIIEIPRNGSSAKVIPETVGQYTGLTDKNGTKIFEGDILCVDIVSGVVLFKNGCFVFHWKNNDKHRPDFYKDCIFTNYGRFNELEVIGNIHDNPELLKENDNA